MLLAGTEHCQSGRSRPHLVTVQALPGSDDHLRRAARAASAGLVRVTSSPIPGSWAPRAREALRGGPKADPGPILRAWRYSCGTTGSGTDTWTTGSQVGGRASSRRGSRRASSSSAHGWIGRMIGSCGWLATPPRTASRRRRSGSTLYRNDYRFTRTLPISSRPQPWTWSRVLGSHTGRWAPLSVIADSSASTAERMIVMGS